MLSVSLHRYPDYPMILAVIPYGYLQFQDIIHNKKFPAFTFKINSYTTLIQLFNDSEWTVNLHLSQNLDYKMRYPLRYNSRQFSTI